MAINLNKKLCAAAPAGHLKTVAGLLASSMTPLNSNSLIAAASNGHFDVVKLLLQVPGCASDISWALQFAAANGPLEIAKIVLSVSGSKAVVSAALQYAAQNDHQDIVKLLLPASDPKADDSRALRYAAQDGPWK